MPPKNPYDLPASIPGLLDTFAKFHGAFGGKDLPRLRLAVEGTMEKFQDACYIGPNSAIAHQIASRLYALIDDAGRYGEDGQQLIAAAVAYFISRHDAIPDATPVTGFDDDVRVLNFVLMQLGIEGNYISLDE